MVLPWFSYGVGWHDSGTGFSVALPMPRVAPLMMATLPLKSATFSLGPKQLGQKSAPIYGIAWLAILLTLLTSFFSQLVSKEFGVWLFLHGAGFQWLSDPG